MEQCVAILSTHGIWLCCEAMTARVFRRSGPYQTLEEGKVYLKLRTTGTA